MRRKINLLKGHIPQHVITEIPLVVDTFRIPNIEKLAHFLGQCSHESSNFTRVFENLNYSVEGLLKTFPTRIKDVYTAQSLANRPEEIANVIYGNRLGNGPKLTGDGWKYRGRGYIQLTGKVNYIAFGKYVTEDDIVDNPDLVATKYPLFSAGWFWGTRKVAHNALDVSDATILQVTKKVNGGTHGLANRIRMTKYFYKLLGGDV